MYSKVDYNSFPITIEKKPLPIVGLIFVIFLMISFATVFFILRADLMQIKAQNSPFIFMFFFVHLFILFIILKSAFMRIAINIDKDFVIFERKDFLKNENWVEPLHCYEGILRKQVFKRSNKHTKIFFAVILIHKNQNKSLTIFESPFEQDARNISEQAAKLLRLPLIEANFGSLDTRQVEDLDKSIKDLVKEGKLTIESLDDRPKTLNVSYEDEKAVVVLNRFQHGVIYLFFVPALLLGLKFYKDKYNIQYEVQNLKPLIGFFIFFGIMWVINLVSFIIDLISRRYLILDQESISYFRKSPLFVTKTKVMNYSEIETINISVYQSIKHLLLSGDNKKLVIGEGLKKYELQWLRAFIINWVGLNLEREVTKPTAQGE